MVNFGIENYGNELWKKCFEDAVTYKKVFYPFSRSLKKHTGLNTNVFYKEMIKKEKSQWIRMIAAMQQKQALKKIGNNLEFYSYPKFRDSILYALKYAFDDPPYLCKFKQRIGFQRRQGNPVSFDFGRYDVSEKYIVWDEINIDPNMGLCRIIQTFTAMIL